MFLLIVHACNFLLTAPGNPGYMCQDFTTTYTENINMMQCLFSSQQVIGFEWYQKHPNWQINKITCKQLKDNGDPVDPKEKKDI